MKKTLLALMISSCFANFYSQITIGSGTTTGSLPADNNYNFTFSEQIFTKTEINAEGPGQITGVKFQLSPSAAIEIRSFGCLDRTYYEKLVCCFE